MDEKIKNKFMKMSVEEFKSEILKYINNDYCQDIAITFDKYPDSYPPDIFGYDYEQFNDFEKAGFTYGKLSIDIIMIPGITELSTHTPMDATLFYCFSRGVKSDKDTEFEMLLEKGQKFRLSKYVNTLINKYEFEHDTLQRKFINNNLTFGFYLVPKDKIYLYRHEAQKLLDSVNESQQIEIIYDDLKNRYNIDKTTIETRLNFYKRLFCDEYKIVYMYGLDLLDYIESELIDHGYFKYKINLHKNFKAYLEQIYKYDFCVPDDIRTDFFNKYNEIMKIKDGYYKKLLDEDYEYIVNFCETKKVWPTPQVLKEGDSELRLKMIYLTKFLNSGLLSDEQLTNLNRLYDLYANDTMGTRSYGELEIARLLKYKKINFITQFKFDDCIDIKPLPFDFYFNIYGYDCVIEFDGLQHFKPIDYFGGEEAFKTGQKHDKIKNKYCKNNDIILIRIKYDALNRASNIIDNVISELKSKSKNDDYNITVNKGGRPDKKDQIIQFRKNNPTANKNQCIKATGISKMTVYKWWNAINENTDS